MTLGALLLLVGLAVFLVDRFDDTAVTREQRVVESGFAQQLRQFDALIVPQVNWDKAVAKVDRTLDIAFADLDFGNQLYTFDGFTHTFFVDGDERVTYAYIYGQHQDPARFEPFRAVTQQLLRPIREAEARRGPIRPHAQGKGPITRPIQANGIARIEGKAYVIMASLVQPDLGYVQPKGPRATVVINAMPIDRAMLNAFAARYLLDRLDLVAAPEVNRDRAYLPLRAPDGAVVAALSWVPRKPGTALLHAMMVPLTAAMTLLALVSWTIVRRSGRCLAALLTPVDSEFGRLDVGCSIGIAVIDGSVGEPSLALRQADLALYRAKARGRGCVFAETGSWPGVRVAINVSAIQMRAPGFAAKLVQIAAWAGIDPARYDIELTETALLTDTPATNENFAVLKRMGFAIVLDDFGTGNSSLSLLHRFRVDKIKIDRSFVADLGQSAEAETLVGAIVKLARSFHLGVIAEGVETEAQKRLLIAAGCEEFQGYLTGRPVPASSVAQLTRNRSRGAVLNAGGRRSIMPVPRDIRPVPIVGARDTEPETAAPCHIALSKAHGDAASPCGRHALSDPTALAPIALTIIAGLLVLGGSLVVRGKGPERLTGAQARGRRARRRALRRRRLIGWTLVAAGAGCLVLMVLGVPFLS
eukprot:gene5628-5687_t